MTRSLDALPVYPGARRIDATGAAPATQSGVDGWFFLARRWHIDAPPDRVAAWYGTRLEIDGSITATGRPPTWMLGGPDVVPDPAVVSEGQVELVVDADGAGSAVTATAGGAPIPVRTDASRIPTHGLGTASVDVDPTCSPVPKGIGPSRAVQVELSASDRDRLVAVLDAAPAMPSGTAGGLECGFDMTLRFASDGDQDYVVEYDSSHPVAGVVLHFGPAEQRSLRPDQEFFSVLQRVTGARLTD